MKPGTRVVIQPEEWGTGGRRWGQLVGAEGAAAHVVLYDGTECTFPRAWVFRARDLRGVRIREDSKLPGLIFWMRCKAFTLGLWIFLTRAAYPRLLRHELIHVAQYRELWYLGFAVLYLAFGAWHLARTRSFRAAYFSIPFEREAHAHDDTPGYLATRKRFAWRGIG